MAQWITRLTTDQKIPGSNPGRIVAFQFLFGGLVFRASARAMKIEISPLMRVTVLKNTYRVIFDQRGRRKFFPVWGKYQISSTADAIQH